MKAFKSSRRLLSMPYLKLVLYLSLIYIGISFAFLIAYKIFGILDGYLKNESVDGIIGDMPKVAVYLLVGVALPFIETLFAQAIVIEVSLAAFKRYKRRNYLAILMSAFLFGFMHRFNLIYALSLFVAGVILAYAYLIGKKRKEPAILLPFIILAIWNIIGLTLKFIM